MHSLAGKSFLSLKGVSRAHLELIFELSREMETIVKARTRTDLLCDKVLGLAFFQVSTRTKMSFESAMVRLGGGVVGFADPKTTRAGDYYAESIEDVVRVMSGYADAIVIRHPQDGAPAQAASVVDVPIINAGDGYNEHPTQALLDAYTIMREKGRLDGLEIAMVGDMNMRVMHSLPLICAQFQSKIHFVSPEDRTMPVDWLEEYDRVGLDYEAHTSAEELLHQIDVIYLMGTKTPSYAKGHVKTGENRVTTPPAYIIDREKLLRARSDAILLHPLPRTDELPKDVDTMAAARYFVQAHYGVAVRMALLSLLLGKTP